jgi:hypothetical protein
MSRCSIIALTAVLLIWVGYLLVRIYYGPNAINKLTMTPFYMTFAMLSAKLILEIVKVFVNAKTLCLLEHGLKIGQIFSDNTDNLRLTQYFFFLVYGFFYLAFTASIFIEYWILWYFIYF